MRHFFTHRWHKIFFRVVTFMFSGALAVTISPPASSQTIANAEPGPVVSISPATKAVNPAAETNSIAPPVGVNTITPNQFGTPQTIPLVAGAPMIPGWGPHTMAQTSWAVSDHDFNLLLAAVNNQTFASDQLPMIQAAGLCGYFTCSQCAALMDVFDFDDNRLKVVSYLAPHLIDPIQCQPIMNELSFVSDRQTAWRIICQANP